MRFRRNHPPPRYCGATPSLSKEGVIIHSFAKCKVTCYYFCMLNIRTNVLIDDEMQATLEYLAKAKGITKAEVIRQMIKSADKPVEVNTKLIALNNIDRLRKLVNTKGINYRKLIEDGRKY